MADDAADQESEAFSLATFSDPSKPRARPPSHDPDPEELSAAATEIVSEPVCKRCFKLGNDVWNPDILEQRDYTILAPRSSPVEDVAMSAREGCPGCEIIAWALEPYVQQVQEDGGQVIVSFGHTTKWMNDRFIYYGKLLSQPKNRHRIELVIKKTPFRSIESSPARSSSPPCPWHFVKSTSMVTCHTGSSAAVEKVQKWYSECLSSHTRCLSNSGSPLPTRIIHIRGLNKARLHVSGTEHAEYACLSHCWGGQSVIQTTTQNLEKYTVDIPWEELPRTFRDAIIFAHSIGFEYLWIDSLCIIQDSLDDWRHEGTRMSDIYANASMTLSATRAANPHQGCFARLDERYMSRLKTFTNSDHEAYELHCHEKLPKSECPLLERGWAFQERMLSRRIVHFMEQELCWECRECCHCECGSNVHGSVSRRSLRMTSFQIRNDVAAGLSKLQSLAEVERTWGQLVVTYSSKSLTYSDDIFPAIQALAKLVPSSMGRYLAGHWEKTLITSLGWSGSRRNKPMKWRAPSWSWAKNQGRVHWSGPGSKYDPIIECATLLSALTIPEGDDSMGQLSSGFIVLRGKVLTGRIQEPERPLDHRLTLSGERIDQFSDFEVMWDTSPFDGSDKEVFALEIFYTESVSAPVSQRWLILEAVEGGKAEYVRTGILHATIPSLDNESFGRVKLPAHIVESYKGAWAAITDRAVEMDLKIV